MAKKWSEMTPRQRRVAIAKDVIARIRAGQLEVDQGAYVSGAGVESPDDLSRIVTKRDVAGLRKRCQVCALGGLLLSRISLFNQLKWEDLFRLYDRLLIEPNQEVCRDGLRGAFDGEELDRIEAAFELYSPGWWEEMLDPEDRVLAIMQNIVDHGRFMSDVEYEIV